MPMPVFRYCYIKLLKQHASQLQRRGEFLGILSSGNYGLEIGGGGAFEKKILEGKKCQVLGDTTKIIVLQTHT